MINSVTSFLAAVATLLAAAPPAPSQSERDLRKWIIGKWTDGQDCSRVTEFFHDGYFLSVTNSRGAWTIVGDTLVFGMTPFKIISASGDTLTLKGADGRVGTSYRCPSARRPNPAINPPAIVLVPTEFRMWRVVRASNGDISAEVRSWGPTPSTRAVLSINCNARGIYSVVTYEGTEMVTDPAMRKYLEGLGNPPWTEYPTRSWIETYREGKRTARFGVNGFHRGQGDPLTRDKIQALSSAEDIRVQADEVVLRFTAKGSAQSISKLLEACPRKR